MPDAVEDLLGTRVARCRSRVRRLLLAVALSARPRVGQLAALADAETLDDAVERRGLLAVDGDHVRPSHPLLAAAVAEALAAARAARAAPSPWPPRSPTTELRALHLALAADAARRGARRRARRGAATRRRARRTARGGRARRARPAPHPARTTRSAASACSRSPATSRSPGEQQRLTDLLGPALDSLPPGAPRVRALRCCSPSGAVSRQRRYPAPSSTGAGREQGDPALRARRARRDGRERRGCRAWSGSPRPRRWRSRRCDAAAPWARTSSGCALYALGWARSLGGRPIDDLCERFEPPRERPLHRRVSRAGGRAAARLARRAGRGRERSDAAPGARRRAGRAVRRTRCSGSTCASSSCAPASGTAAERLLDEWAESSDRELLHLADVRALPRAARRGPRPRGRGASSGRPRRSSRAAATGVRWDLLEALRARGIAALLAHEPARAVESLRAVWEHTRARGCRRARRVPRRARARRGARRARRARRGAGRDRRLRELAEQQDHPGGSRPRGAAPRSSASRDAYDEQRGRGLAAARRGVRRLGLRFDRARVAPQPRPRAAAAQEVGRGARHARAAVAAFDELGSPGWADAARSELARVGARRPAPSGELTPAERRVAELAADGLANKEIAQALVVTVTRSSSTSRTPTRSSASARARSSRRASRSSTTRPPEPLRAVAHPHSRRAGCGSLTAGPRVGARRAGGRCASHVPRARNVARAPLARVGARPSARGARPVPRLSTGVVPGARFLGSSVVSEAPSRASTVEPWLSTSSSSTSRRATRTSPSGTPSARSKQAPS